MIVRTDLLSLESRTAQPLQDINLARDHQLHRPAKFEKEHQGPIGSLGGSSSDAPLGTPCEAATGSLSMELRLCALINDRLKGEGMELRPAKANHVRRNLFGPVDHDHLQQDFQNILWASVERAMQRWNFDFLQDKPTEGLLQWEELPVCEVPNFYHTCLAGQVRHPLQSMNWDVAKESKMPHTGRVVEKNVPDKKITRKKSMAGKKRKQTSLSDYYMAKKQIRVDVQTTVKNVAV